MSSVGKAIRFVNDEVIMTRTRYDALVAELRVWRGLHHKLPKLLSEFTEACDELSRHATRINLMTSLGEDDKTSRAYRVGQL